MKIEEMGNKIFGSKYERYETWYRGYNYEYGSQRNHLIWLTTDISYARAYGNVVEKVVVDNEKLNAISLYDCDDILGYEIDYYDGPNEDEIRELLSQGFNCYYFDANHDMSECMCLWENSAIISRKELSEEEFNAIETYDGFDNKPYKNKVNEKKTGLFSKYFNFSL